MIAGKMQDSRRQKMFFVYVSYGRMCFEYISVKSPIRKTEYQKFGSCHFANAVRLSKNGFLFAVQTIASSKMNSFMNKIAGEKQLRILCF